MMKKIIISSLVYGMFFVNNANCKEVFTIGHIEESMTEKNPYVYSVMGKSHIDSARIETAKGVFDTGLSGEYNEKDYPLSDSVFSDIELTKPTESGVEFITGYREAAGKQEYNNIKTGDKGEFRVGVKLPIFSIFEGMNKEKYTLDSAKIDSEESLFKAKNNLRKLYNQVINSYYQLLYYNEELLLEKGLFKKAEKRKIFIEKRVREGDLSELSLLEVKQQIINRKQRLLLAKNNKEKALISFLKYIQKSKKEFNSKYNLPSLNVAKEENIILEDIVKIAMKNRQDLKSIETKKSKLDLDNRYNGVSKYGNLNAYAYGIHDIEYGNGVKVGVQFEIPLERNVYNGRKLEIQKSRSLLDEEQNKILIEIKANLSNLIYSLNIARESVGLGLDEISILSSLEKMEKKQYEVGTSNLFLLNQREMSTLEVKKRQLQYYLRILRLRQEIRAETGQIGNRNTL